MKLYYYELENSVKPLNPFQAESDQKAVEIAKIRASLSSDNLLMVYVENGPGQFDTVFYAE